MTLDSYFQEFFYIVLSRESTLHHPFHMNESDSESFASAHSKQVPCQSKQRELRISSFGQADGIEGYCYPTQTDVTLQDMEVEVVRVQKSGSDIYAESKMQQACFTASKT